MADDRPQSPFRVLLTGSRTWADKDRLYGILTGVWREHPGMLLVHGAAKKGADLFADLWALQAGHPGTPPRGLGHVRPPGRDDPQRVHGLPRCWLVPRVRHALHPARLPQR